MEIEPQKAKLTHEQIINLVNVYDKAVAEIEHVNSNLKFEITVKPGQDIEVKKTEENRN